MLWVAGGNPRPPALSDNPDMLEEKYTYRRPEFLQLNEESEQAASDHESRPIVIPHRELPFNAGYAE